MIPINEINCIIDNYIDDIFSALCGFANPSSIGIQLAGLGAMAPSRKTDLSQVVFRAFFAGVLTTCMNACVAGSLLSSKQ